MDNKQIIFETDFLLWNKLVFLIKRRPLQAEKQFGIDEELTKRILASQNVPKRLASTTLLSFVLEESEYAFSHKLFPDIGLHTFINNEISFADIGYWIYMRTLAQTDREMAAISFAAQPALIDWVLQASDIDIFKMAVGTTDSLVLRYPQRLINSLLDATAEGVQDDPGTIRKLEVLNGKRAMLALRQLEAVGGSVDGF